MRIVAGELRGRRLVAPGGDATRPTTDRVREAIFNALGSLGVVDGALVVDLYAGSGALGFEALSRGAEHCTFVERDRAALSAIEANRAELGLAVEKLRGEVTEATDWRKHLEANQQNIMIGAAVLGFVLTGGVAAIGGLFRRKPR